MVEYSWSSYETFVSEKETKLKRKEVIEAYDDKQNFIFYHNQNHNLKDIKSLIIE